MGDGDRTRDIRCHRPTLYQLSYSHHSGASLTRHAAALNSHRVSPQPGVFLLNPLLSLLTSNALLISPAAIYNRLLHSLQELRPRA